MLNSRAIHATRPPGGFYHYANSALPRPGNGLADLHVILAQAVVGDDAGLDARARQMQGLVREGRYPSGAYLPALARGFASFEREDFSGADRGAGAAGGPKRTHWLPPRTARLIEFTLLRAYIEANRLQEAKRLLDVRRPGASGVPSWGLPRCID